MLKIRAQNPQFRRQRDCRVSVCLEVFYIVSVLLGTHPARHGQLSNSTIRQNFGLAAVVEQVKKWLAGLVRDRLNQGFRPPIEHFRELPLQRAQITVAQYA